MAIASAIISMAHTLCLSVIAEGVERAEQAEFLARAGCEKLQGFLYSRAVEPGAFETLLITDRTTPLGRTPGGPPSDDVVAGGDPPAAHAAVRTLAESHTSAFRRVVPDFPFSTGSMPPSPPVDAARPASRLTLVSSNDE